MESLSQAVFCVITLVLALMQGAYSKKEKALLPCGGQQVCATLMKYKDGTITDEGDYCECKDVACSKEWSDSDGATLSWQHYERAHWHVQYKLCRPLLVDKPECRGSELGAEVETSTTEWSPVVTLPRCVCAEAVPYQITGWRREGTIWKYEYSCVQTNCTTPPEKSGEKSLCAKIYIDTNKKTDKVMEMQFECSCPEGYLCPAKYNDKEDHSKAVKDEFGSYVPKFCELVVKRKRSS